MAATNRTPRICIFKINTNKMIIYLIFRQMLIGLSYFVIFPALILIIAVLIGLWLCKVIGSSAQTQMFHSRANTPEGKRKERRTDRRSEDAPPPYRSHFISTGSDKKNFFKFLIYIGLLPLTFAEIKMTELPGNLAFPGEFTKLSVTSLVEANSDLTTNVPEINTIPMKTAFANNTKVNHGDLKLFLKKIYFENQLTNATLVAIEYLLFGIIACSVITGVTIIYTATVARGRRFYVPRPTVVDTTELIRNPHTESAIMAVAEQNMLRPMSWMSLKSNDFPELNRTNVADSRTELVMVNENTPSLSQTIRHELYGSSTSISDTSETERREDADIFHSLDEQDLFEDDCTLDARRWSRMQYTQKNSDEMDFEKEQVEFVAANKRREQLMKLLEWMGYCNFQFRESQFCCKEMEENHNAYHITDQFDSIMYRIYTIGHIINIENTTTEVFRICNDFLEWAACNPRHKYEVITHPVLRHELPRLIFGHSLRLLNSIDHRQTITAYRIQLENIYNDMNKMAIEFKNYYRAMGLVIPRQPKSVTFDS